MDATFQSSSFDEPSNLSGEETTLATAVKKPPIIRRSSTASSVYGSVFEDDDSPALSELSPVPEGFAVSGDLESLAIDKALESLQNVPAKRSFSEDGSEGEIAFAAKKLPPTIPEEGDMQFSDVFDADQAASGSGHQDTSPSTSIVEDLPSHGVEIREQSSRIRVRRHTSFEEEERLDLDAVLEAASMETAKRSDAFVEALHAGVTPEDVDRILVIERQASASIDETPAPLTPVKEEPGLPLVLGGNFPASAEALLPKRPETDNASDFDLESVLAGEAAAKAEREAAAAANDLTVTPAQTGGMMEHPIESDYFPSAVSPRLVAPTIGQRGVPPEESIRFASTELPAGLHHREASEFDLAAALRTTVADIDPDMAVQSPRIAFVQGEEQVPDTRQGDSSLDLASSAPPSDDFMAREPRQRIINDPGTFATMHIRDTRTLDDPTPLRTPPVTRQTSVEGGGVNVHPRQLTKDDIEDVGYMAAEPEQVLIIDEKLVAEAPGIPMEEGIRTPPVTRQNSIYESEPDEDDDEQQHHPVTPAEVEHAAERANQLVNAPLFPNVPAVTNTIADPAHLTQTDLLNRQLLMSAAASSIPSHFFQANRGGEEFEDEEEEEPMEDGEDEGMSLGLKAYIDQIKAAGGGEMTPPEFPSIASDFSFQPDVNLGGPLKLQRQFTSETDFEIGSTTSPSPHRTTPADNSGKPTEEDASTASSSASSPPMMMMTPTTNEISTPMTSAALAAAAEPSNSSNEFLPESVMSRRNATSQTVEAVPPVQQEETTAFQQAPFEQTVPSQPDEPSEEEGEFEFQQAPAAPVASASSANDEAEEDDDFGDFEEADTAMANAVPAVIAPPPSVPVPVPSEPLTEAPPTFFASQVEPSFDDMVQRPPCTRCGAPTNFDVFTVCVSCGEGQKPSATTPGSVTATRLTTKASAFQQPQGNQSILNDLLNAIEFETCLEDPSSLPIAALAATDNDGALRVLLGDDVVDTRTPVTQSVKAPETITIKKQLDSEEDKSFYVV